MKINEEVINGKLYFYHSAKNLNTAKYIINKQWRTSSGLYGDGVYGQQYPDPTSPENKLTQHTIDRYKSIYGGSYRFKIRYDNPKDVFYLDLDAGKEVYGDSYDSDMALDILKQHKVPVALRRHLSEYFSYGSHTPALSNSKLATYTGSDGLLGQYGFKGLAYHGNSDGKCILYWYPNEGHLTVEGYSTDFGKTWTEYDANDDVQVAALKQEIQDKINELAGHIDARERQKQASGKTPALKVMGKDRDWVRMIEAGNKAGYDFKAGDFTSGDIHKFASLVQRQINASKEPKRTNRYEIAIKLISEVESLITK